MADGQIRFYYTNDVNSLDASDGAVIISKRDEEKQLADIFANLDGRRYQVKPLYNWEEIQERPDIEAYIDEHMHEGIEKVLAKYFIIERSMVNGELQLDIYANEALPL